MDTTSGWASVVQADPIQEAIAKQLKTGRAWGVKRMAPMNDRPHSYTRQTQGMEGGEELIKERSSECSLPDNENQKNLEQK